MVPAAGSKLYGLGIVGCGVISARHAQAIGSLGNARLVAATDVVYDKAAAFAHAQGCEADRELDQLLERSDVDVVSVCVPSGLHAEIGVRAAQAGKHLVVEKPIDISLAAADRLIDAVRANGVKMAVISQHRFDSGVVALRRLLDEGRLGRLVLGDARIKWYRSQAYYDSGDWRGTWALDGGGALMNQGVHYADLLRWCMGPVSEVCAVCVTSSHQIEVEDIALAVVRFASGAVGCLEATTAAYPGFHERLEVTGSAGTAIVDDGALVVHETVPERGEVGFYGTKTGEGTAGSSSAASDPMAISTDSHTPQFADLLAAIEQDRAPAVSGEDGRNALELVLAVYESARRRAPVSVPLA